VGSYGPDALKWNGNYDPGIRRLTSPTVLETPAFATDVKAEARKAFLLVFSCTLIGAVAQILMKTGSTQLGSHVSLLDVARRPTLILSFFLGVVSNIRLFAGYCFYGINTFLMALALKGRELSRLYPIIALTYVWVTVLSLFLLPDEHLNFFRSMGIAFIVGGVSVLGLKK
jgi:multidrug transporter EmrE-like cation transporter